MCVYRCRHIAASLCLLLFPSVVLGSQPGTSRRQELDDAGQCEAAGRLAGCTSLLQVSSAGYKAVERRASHKERAEDGGGHEDGAMTAGHHLSPEEPNTNEDDDNSTQLVKDFMEQPEKEEPEHSEHEAHSGHKVHVAPNFHFALAGVFVALVFGCLTNSILERYLPALPYTCVLFVQGFAVSMMEESNMLPWVDVAKAVNSWQHVDPHFAFYTLLTPLVFADALNMNISMLKHCFWQCMLLAGPGVLIGAGMIGCVAKFVLPYGWDWCVAMLFGSILSATDPVAVVAIFGSLGVSPRLTTLVSGEALFNDGTAVVVFELMLMFVLGSTPTLYGVADFFARKAILGPLFGLILGNIATYWIGKTSRGHFHGDGMSQIIVTICCGYLAFIVAELELTSSGVLAAVVAGATLAASAWPRFVSRASIRSIWHTVEFVANTLIFVLAGLLFGQVCVRHHITWMDWGFLFLNYVLVNVIRMIMLLMVWPLLNRLGSPLSFAEIIVMAWSGLRGAVGLLMAVIVDSLTSSHFKAETTSRILFHVGGIAALTLLINGTLTPYVLRRCGLMASKKEQERLIAEVAERVAWRTQKHLSQELDSEDPSHLFEGVVEDDVAQYVPALRVKKALSPTRRSMKPPAHQASGESSEFVVRMLREMVLRAVLSVYQDLGDRGIIEKRSDVMSALVDSVNKTLMCADDKLSDWKVLKTSLQLGVFTTEDEYKIAARSMQISSSYAITAIQGGFSRYRDDSIYAALAFIHAHGNASKELTYYFGQQEKEVVEFENQEQIDDAKELLQDMPSDLVSAARTKMLASKLLHFQAELVSDLTQKGVILDEDAGHMEHKIHESMSTLEDTPLAGAPGARAAAPDSEDSS